MSVFDQLLHTVAHAVPATSFVVVVEERRPHSDTAAVTRLHMTQQCSFQFLLRELGGQEAIKDTVWPRANTRVFQRDDELDQHLPVGNVSMCVVRCQTVDIFTRLMPSICRMMATWPRARLLVRAPVQKSSSSSSGSGGGSSSKNTNLLTVQRSVPLTSVDDDDDDDVMCFVWSERQKEWLLTIDIQEKTNGAHKVPMMHRNHDTNAFVVGDRGRTASTVVVPTLVLSTNHHALQQQQQGIKRSSPLKMTIVVYNGISPMIPGSGDQGDWFGTASSINQLAPHMCPLIAPLNFPPLALEYWAVATVMRCLPHDTADGIFWQGQVALSDTENAKTAFANAAALMPFIAFVQASDGTYTCDDTWTISRATFAKLAQPWKTVVDHAVLMGPKVDTTWFALRGQSMPSTISSASTVRWRECAAIFAGFVGTPLFWMQEAWLNKQALCPDFKEVHTQNGNCGTQ